MGTWEFFISTAAWTADHTAVILQEDASSILVEVKTVVRHPFGNVNPLQLNTSATISDNMEALDTQVARLEKSFQEEDYNRDWSRDIRAAPECVWILAECLLITSKSDGLAIELKGQGLEYNHFFFTPQNLFLV